MRRAALALALLVGLAAPAFALSCLPHSVEAAFVAAQEAKQEYVIVRGSLSFDRRKLPKVNWDRQGDTPTLTRIPATLKGKSLTSGGFAVPFDRNVILAVACYGPWCAQVPRGTEVLAFVERGTGGHEIAINPCGGFLFSDPDPIMIRKLRACLADQSCVPETR